MKVCLLTKSDKHNGYCVAGVNTKGDWVRLVSTKSGEAIKGNFPYAIASWIEVKGERAPLVNQPENYLLSEVTKTSDYNIKSKCIGELSENKFNPNLFGNVSHCLKSNEIKNIRHQLTAVFVEKLQIYKNENENFKSKFVYNGDTYENMSLTDSRYYKECFFDKAALIVSHPIYLIFVTVCIISLLRQCTR